MSTTVKYVRAESLSQEQRTDSGLPDQGTVVLEVTVNSPVSRKYIPLPKSNFLNFLKEKAQTK